MKKKWDRKLRGGDEEEDEEEEGDVDVGGRARNNNIWAAWCENANIGVLAGGGSAPPDFSWMTGAALSIGLRRGHFGFR